MPTKRSDVLITLYQILEGSPELCALVGHTPGANTIEDGARILADSVRIQGIEDHTMLILSFSDEPPSNRNRDTLLWNLELWVYAPDIFAHADILDALQRVCDEYQMDSSHPATINRLQWGGHQRITPQDIPTRLLVTRAVITTTYI
ncbi:DUF1795 domain-containing protein [Deinococcus cellulosilyticus]|uniref:Uncharacterized protein n=1 Tax=Deinococcus cellulosilyticus (strain DSM 18568 / NBRC 106333 / KACC 11606 / 5516J-15) TaxID=1223518 RepID=A0A511N2Y7_DEIC1|nr:DUF1795 domain-containing protein [Deinococcus cellulosilyticus]GEM47213.1 hypothetical protein DC3_28480 [Deinococcus cellulosilyticus NBRC 106333 = KACC 11606]